MAGSTEQNGATGEAFPEDIGEIIASSVLERSFAMARPFRVNFDVDCSFCRKNETEVEKLVAGPKLYVFTVYICDQCVDIASRLMRSSETARFDILPPH
jgi:hypothetical protein